MSGLTEEVVHINKNCIHIYAKCEKLRLLLQNKFCFVVLSVKVKKLSLMSDTFLNNLFMHCVPPKVMSFSLFLWQIHEKLHWVF